MSESEFRTPYPGYDVLDKRDTPSWDDITRRAVAERLENVPQARFFTPHEWRTLQAVCDRILPQPERGAEAVPIVPWIDEMLFFQQTEGYRDAALPPVREAWRGALEGIDQDSEARFERPFVELPPSEQDTLLRAVQHGEVHGAAWQKVPAAKFFTQALLGQIVTTYYAHPAAWSEIGFGGPANPRGYVRLAANKRDPWEAQARRNGEDAR